MSHNAVHTEAANGYYRSQDMTYVSITIPNEVASETIHAIGKMGKFHMVDLASKEHPSKEYNFYKKHVADCVFWEKKLVDLARQMDDFKVVLPNASVEEVKVARVLEGVEEFLTPVEEELERNRRFLEQTQVELCKAIEHRHVLQAFRNFEFASIGDDDGKERKRSADAPLLADDFSHEMAELKDGKRAEQKKEERFRKILTGTLQSARQEDFRRMLYRITRGNAITGFFPINEPLTDATGDSLEKAVFYVMLLGEQTESRVKKMCGIFGANLYEVPEEQKDFDRELNNKATEISIQREVMEKTKKAMVQVLQQLAYDEKKSNSPLKTWYHLVAVEKQVSRKYMKAHFYKSTIVTEGWCPNKYLDDLRSCLKEAVKGSGVPPAAMDENPTSTLAAVGSPPTYFETNKVTEMFQGIVDTYGTPRYKEVNPGLFTIVTFPFLFGVMYGDIGHGTLLSIFGFWMLFNERKFLKKQQDKTLGDIEDMVFSGRYVIFMMGLFATYCGFIYNDCFSLPLHLAESHWNTRINSAGEEEYYYTGAKVYPFGIDPSWYHKSNELIFFNSVKMKLAVTLGVVQMTFGILLSCSNHLYFHDWISIFFEFIPRLTFMLCTFGYMIFLIVFKACVDWSGGGNPPSLIQTMIKMFLSPGKIDPKDQLFDGQAGFQVFLLVMALVSVPIMLCVKPCYNRSKHKHDVHEKLGEEPDDEEHGGHHGHPHEDDGHDVGMGIGEEKGAIELKGHDEHKEHKMHKKTGAGGADPHGHGGPYSFSDDFIHTAIHTIEFVLGTVSNTASYLRLWALSLAHAELANVFWSKMLVQYGVDTKNPIMVLIGFAVWVAATFGVLMAMDVLECFLHALRLHWVEFQNKFYYADGYPFKPFTLDDRDED